MPDGDELDFSNRYNTTLPASDESLFQNWLGRQSQAVGRDVSNDLYDYDLRGWWAKNPGADLAGGHLTDEFKKPNHPTFSDQSMYHGVDGMQGGQWAPGEAGSWAFTPGPSNFHSTQELGDYFKQVEPGNKLILPES